MTGYTSKRRLLYTKVMFGILIFFGLIFSYVFFLMKPQVILQFSTSNSVISYNKKIPNREVTKGDPIGQGTYNLFNTFVDKHELEGYTFEGWSYGPAIDDVLTPKSVFEVPTTLRAIWVAKLYDLVFDFSGETMADIYFDEGASLPIESKTIVFNKDFEIPSTHGIYKDVLKEGEVVYYKKRLAGYVNKKTNVTYLSGNIITLNNINDIYVNENISNETTVYGEVVLTPLWEDVKTEITVNFGLEDVNPLIIKVNIGDTMANIKTQIDKTIKDNNIQKPDHKVGGYYHDAGFSNEINDNTVFYDRPYNIFVKWVEKTYSVIFDSNGGSLIEPSQGVSYTGLRLTDRIVEPEPPQLSGKEFKGWYTLKNGTVKVDLLNAETNTFITFQELSSKFSIKDRDEYTLFARWEDEQDFSDDDYEYYSTGFFTYEKIKGVDGLKVGRPKTPSIKGYRHNTKYKYYLLVPKSVKIAGSDTPLPVLEIDYGTFANLNTVNTIYIPETVISIDDQAFINNFLQLENIKVSTKNQYYKDIDGVLYNYEGTKLIKYPAGRADETYLVGQEGRRVEIINKFAFSSANNLTSVTLNVKTIDNSAFDSAINLTNVIFEAPVEILGYRVFIDTNVSSINTDRNRNFSFSNKVLYNYEQTKLVYFADKTAESYTIIDGVTEIAPYAFENAALLKEVSLSGVTKINERAFPLPVLEKVSISTLILHENIVSRSDTRRIGSFFGEGVNEIKITTNVVISQEVLIDIYKDTGTKKLIINTSNTGALALYDTKFLNDNNIDLIRV